MSTLALDAVDGAARITCRGVDVTEHVARMYDAIVASLDWGSGFLTTEDVESILIVAELAGFGVPEAAGGDPPGIDPTKRGGSWTADHRAAIVAWRAQIKAKAQAMVQGDSENSTTERIDR